MPLHEPWSTASVSPTRAVPMTSGVVSLRGGSAVIAAVRSEAAVARPAVFVAVTCTRSAAPTSSPVVVYVRLVAPAMSTHVVAVAQRCHW